MESFAKKLSDSEEKLCIVGAGTLLRANLMQLIQMFGRKPDLLLDQNYSNWDADLFGVQCSGFEKLSAVPKTSNFVIAVSDYNDTAKLLIQNGFSNVFFISFERTEWKIKAVNSVADFESKLPHIDFKKTDLANTTSYISGATGGIGTQIALHMAEFGSKLYLHGRCQQKLNDLAEQLIEKGAVVETFACDYLDDNDLMRHCDWLENYRSKIDFFYLNAGVSKASEYGGLKDGCIRGWEETLKINLIAPWAILRSIYSKASKGSTVVKCFLTTSSINKEIDSQAYACSKAALDKMMFDSTQALEHSNLEICSIDPGWVSTPMGGDNAPFAASSVIPGAVFATHCDHSVAGSTIGVQNYRGLTVEQAIKQGILLGDLSVV